MTSNSMVFVVDGDVAVRESLERLIEASGWRARTFASANEFLAQPRVVAPSCMVLDVALPGLSGLDLVVSGLLNKQVGGELGISEVTVKAHRGQVMRKMQADSLAGLMRMADRLGVPPTAAHWAPPVTMTGHASAALSI